MFFKIWILVIVLYLSMEFLLIKLLEEYFNVDLIIIIGDLKKGVEIV